MRSPYPTLLLVTIAGVVIASNTMGQSPTASPNGEQGNAMIAVGELRPDRRLPNGRHRYALVDERGQVNAYVLASPQLDLRRFMRRVVGVTAGDVRRGPEGVPYILPHRISLLNEQPLRPIPQAHEPTMQNNRQAMMAARFPETRPMGSGYAGGRVAPAGFASRAQHNMPEVVPPGDVGSGTLDSVDMSQGAGPAGQPITDGMYDAGYPSIDNSMADSAPMMSDGFDMGMGNYGGGDYGGFGEGDFSGGGNCHGGFCGGNGSGGSCGNACGPACEDCGCGRPGRWWVRGEYLLWFANGMDLPPLVTTSPINTPQAAAGVLGEPNTSILYGGDSILDDVQNGWRGHAGIWLDRCQTLGFEGDFLRLGSESERFRASSDDDGDPILARPFFNINPRDPDTGDFDPPAREDAQLVSFPGLLSGRVTVDSSTRLQSAGARFRLNLCCLDGSCQDPCAQLGNGNGWGNGYGQNDGFGYGNGYGGNRPIRDALLSGGLLNGRANSSQFAGRRYSRVDLLAGYRYAELKDELSINEELTVFDQELSATFDITDQFNTRNEFNGGDVGAAWEVGWRRWSLEVLTKVALGNVHQSVDIQGTTVETDEVGDPLESSGGLLAQETNIGHHSRNQFGVIPEVGASLGFNVTPRLRTTVGYTLLYWSNVVRPGDQIDLDVNPDYLPPPIEPIEGPARPAFAFRDSAYWAQGLTVGLEYRR